MSSPRHAVRTERLYSTVELMFMITWGAVALGITLALLTGVIPR